jgi:hypothetical protein
MTGLNYGTEVQRRRNYKSLILKIPWPQRREIAPLTRNSIGRSKF